jgi:hypothetical protein
MLDSPEGVCAGQTRFDIQLLPYPLVIPPMASTWAPWQGTSCSFYSRNWGAYGARRPCSPPFPATMLPHHNGEVAMPRRRKTLIFLTALLATT